MAHIRFYKRTLLWLLGFVGLFFLAGFLYTNAYVLWLASGGELSTSAIESQLNQWLNSASGLAGLVLLQGAMLLPFTLFAMYKFKQYSWRQWLPWRAVSGKVGWLVAGLYVAYMIIQVIIVRQLDLDNSAFLSAVAGSRSLLLLFCLAVLAPVYEELFFRGYLYGAWRHSRLGFIGSAVLISLIFALLHGAQYGWVQMGFIFTLSMIMTYAREASGSLRAPIYLHMVNNFLPAWGLLYMPV